MRIPKTLLLIIKDNNNTALELYKSVFLKYYTLNQWNRLYLNAVDSLSNSAKAFPNFDDESYECAIEPGHNED